MRLVLISAILTFQFLFSYRSQAQKLEILLGPDEIAENQFWTISVTARNETLRNHDPFPDIDGFRKRGSSTQTQTSIINGQMSSTQSVVTNYQPLRQGVFIIPPFKMKINGQVISSPGKRVKVLPPVQTQARDPFQSLFDRDPYQDPFNRREQEFIDVKEDAFLAVSTDRKEVFTGEGFTTKLSFYVAESNKAPLQFFELGEQLTDILKKLRPEACWEENFNIENIEGETVEIGGKTYTEYKIYQAAFYPLNGQTITIPAVGLKMIKFKVARNPSFFNQNRQEDFKTFYSKPVTVKVKELPPHPLRESVAVGNFRLEENISTQKIETGKSIEYDFTLIGSGNISGIQNPAIRKDQKLELFDPNIRQSINRQNGIVSGAKTFSYYLIPQDPGTYNLSDYISMIVFNTATRQYDTLRPSLKFEVTGESKQNVVMSSNDANSFYDRIGSASNQLTSGSDPEIFKNFLNIFILIALVVSGYIVIKR
jgi:hypothetical protein